MKIYIKQIFLIIFLFSSFSKSTLFSANSFQNILNSKAKYFFCIEGGSSKTTLQILDNEGKTLSIKKGDVSSFLLKVPGTNILTVKKEKISQILQELFEDIEIGDEKLSFNEILSKSAFIGGFAGIDRKNERNLIEEILIKCGFSSNNIALYSYARLAIKLLKNNGAVLISGTTSICLAKNKGKVYRTGGFGRMFGEEGSGYEISILAIKAALEEECGYGQAFSLTPLIIKHFKVSAVNDLISPIHSEKISTAEIASFAPYVFEEAQKGNKTAKKIIDKTAYDLGKLLKQALQHSNERNPMVYLLGSVFKNKYSHEFIKKILESFTKEKPFIESKPLFINITSLNIPSLVVKETLLKNKINFTLPIMSEPESSEKVFKYHNINFVSTEQKHHTTQQLSQIFHKDQIKALKLLHEVDKNIIKGCKEFTSNFGEDIYSSILKKLSHGGKIFLVGSGSSGRVSIDLAAKWKQFCDKTNLKKYSNLLVGVISGKSISYVKTKKGLEDSEDQGERALNELNIRSKDMVILISGSGSTKFNVGAAKKASEVGAKTYYLFNSKQVPVSTNNLFINKQAIPILIDIGPQAITGLTKLQSASLSELCLGITLNCAAKSLNEKQKLPFLQTSKQFINQMEKSNTIIAEYFQEINDFINLEIEILSSPKANFRKVKDETKSGYITFLGYSNSLREIMMDTNEIPSAFSTNPPRRINEVKKKKAEFRSYMIENYGNLKCWEALINRKLTTKELYETQKMLISYTDKGFGSFLDRPKDTGNLVIGVLKDEENPYRILKLYTILNKIQSVKGKTAIISINNNNCLYELTKEFDASISINIPYKDPLEIIPTLVLKQIINMISNGTMIGMNKVLGNTIIDVSPENKKLVDRSIRIISEIYHKKHPKSPTLNYEKIYHLVIRTYNYKKLLESQYGIYAPSTIKVVLMMLEKNIPIAEAIEILRKNNEDISSLLLN
jgi:N-acetylmuramic acid 6-phosphate (MurNAc-6-P) etherase/N-acetylglucosamine kinase-like BadF-type ATPase